MIAAALFLLAPSGNGFAFAAAGHFLIGFGPMLWLICQTTVRQLVTPAPMLGRVAVAPPGEQSWGGLWPGEFGGNMDNKELVAGSTLYLPVHYAGSEASVVTMPASTHSSTPLSPIGSSA